MEARELVVAGSYELTPSRFADERGVIAVTHDDRELATIVGHPMFPVRQCTSTRSVRGAVRGIHYTATPPGSAKFVYCPHGRALEFVVDLRVGSPTFGRWDSVVLDGDGAASVFLPTGVGLAFVALEEETTIHYMLSQRFKKEREHAVSVLDPELALPLPVDMDLCFSTRDRDAPTIKQARDAGYLPRYQTSQALEDGLYLALPPRSD
ncbi:hypothetical protein AD006_30045 (plasmid) [Pseudonocardia sp. EC080610-09]|uniref:dTDP-4-dehydrorhamnose 3,5-epimerase family protein n=1 Tax=unclassified Pseudonocardia TaxID=2619320 RepID=UPI000706D03F|nr:MULTISPECIES: dTDP-4-dehydrorhamnose 3,5-epimerase [unclassified Pseudonocardia]ALL79487.1 hypothetical protein AD006_30045 [Pseudonocardia sp. EC080610-09]ALL85560.1 hypothetical protein AD017_31205 [Pseudonocardia sp. EC080619-01]